MLNVTQGSWGNWGQLISAHFNEILTQFPSLLKHMSVWTKTSTKIKHQVSLYANIMKIAAAGFVLKSLLNRKIFLCYVLARLTRLISRLLSYKTEKQTRRWAQRKSVCVCWGKGGGDCVGVQRSVAKEISFVFLSGMQSNNTQTRMCSGADFAAEQAEMWLRGRNVTDESHLFLWLVIPSMCPSVQSGRCFKLFIGKHNSWCVHSS